MSDMTLLQAIQCLQCPTRHGQALIERAAGLILKALKRYAMAWRSRLPIARDVEDMASQIFERLWCLLPSKTDLDSDGRAKAYLKACVRNEALKLLQRARRSPLSPTGLRELADGGGAEYGHEKALYQSLEALIEFTAARRAAKQRAWLVESAHEMLLYLTGDGLPRSEISKLRCISISNLYQRHKRTREALREALPPFCRARGLPDEMRHLLAACIEGLTRP